jgi:dolichyl-phosphate-mannose-protein mannosyltransferase
VSEASAEAGAAAKVLKRTFFDRALAAIPIAALGLAVLAFYSVEAWTRGTPWLFTDEIEWSQLSRAIATTGHAARRGEPTFFKSIYAYAIAPFWWIHSTQTAYAGIKYLNAFMISLAAVPTYLLARMLVSRRMAIAAGLLAVAIPGMSYATTIIPESMAYPWFALCAWLSVRALTTRRPRHLVLAVAVSAIAMFVKLELEIVLGALAIAAAGLWVTGPRGRALRANWTRGDTFGAIVLLIGGIFLFNHVVLEKSYEWHQATEYWKSRMIDLGLSAAAALAIGLGILPVVAGFVAMRLPDRRGDPAYRAFAAYLASSILVFSLYTASKAAYLSTQFSTLIEERNLIYLSPLLLVATVLVLESRRVDWRIVAAAVAFALFLVLTKPIQLDYPYFEAPGFSILAVATRRLGFEVADLHWSLVAAAAVGVTLLAFRRHATAKALATVFLLAWLLTGEIGATAGDNSFGKFFRSYMPPTRNSIDLITHGQHVTFLGQSLKDPNGILLAEFWNRSLVHMASLDNTAPGPGPLIGPQLVSIDGRLSYYTGDHYVLAGPGITLQGTVVGNWGGLDLYHITGVWKLRAAVQGLYSDGWAQERSAYTLFPRGGAGTLVIDLRRTGYTGNAEAGNVVIQVGTVQLKNQEPVISQLIKLRRTIIQNGGEQIVRIPVKTTPLRVEVQISPTFQPNTTDTRQLGAQESFTFCPAKGPAPPACKKWGL